MALSRTKKAAFGFGAFGKDLVYMLVSGYILYYYNAVLGMDSKFIGAILMAARVFDALNDPVMGIVVGKTRTRWGRYRPWILTGTAVNALITFALFAVPGSLGADSAGARLWLSFFYLAWGVSYTLMDIPFWAMIPAITRPGTEREKLSSLARACAGIGDALPSVLTMLVVPALSASAVVAEYRIGFKWWALIISAVFLVSEIVCCLTVKEPAQTEVKSQSIREMFQALLANDQAQIVVLTIICVYAALNLVSNLLLYFFQYDLGNTDLYSTFVGVCFGAQVLAMALLPQVTKRIKMLKVFSMGLLVQIAGFVILLLIALTGSYHSVWALLLVPGVLVYSGYGVLNVLLTVFLSDTVDYGELKNGTRDEAVIFSMQTFTVKLASGLAVFVSGLAIDLIGLNPALEAQSEATLAALRYVVTIPSIVLLIAALVIFTKFYRLDEQKMAEVTAGLKTGR